METVLKILAGWTAISIPVAIAVGRFIRAGRGPEVRP